MFQNNVCKSRFYRVYFRLPPPPRADRLIVLFFCSGVHYTKERGFLGAERGSVLALKTGRVSNSDTLKWKHFKHWGVPPVKISSQQFFMLKIYFLLSRTRESGGFEIFVSGFGFFKKYGLRNTENSLKWAILFFLT